MAPFFSFASFGGGIASKLLGPTVPVISATVTGGVTTINSDGFRIHVFTSPGSFIVSDITCYSANNGSISIYASGGQNLEYFKSNGLTTFSQISNTFNSIAPANYVFSVKDFKGWYFKEFCH